ncbi:MAG: 50S ribosomal protein L10 [archaeon]
MKAHVSQTKKDEVVLLKELFKKYKVIAIGDLTLLPSRQLQEIRSKLKKNLLIRVSKKRLIKKAIDEFKEKDLSKLNNYMDDDCIPVLLFTNESPFKLYNLLKKSKSKAAIKSGQIAPEDLIVKDGPTSFPPGPIIGELGAVGIVASVEHGKVVIKREKVVAKKGDVVNQKIADILGKLGTKPMEIGLNLKVGYEDGMFYDKSILDIDEEQIKNDLKLAYNYSLNLAVKINYATKETVKILIRKAVLETNALENNENIKKALEVHGERKTDEQVAQDVLKKLQDEKIKKMDESNKNIHGG